MSEIAINYKGNSIATMDASGTKTLLTSGKYCEDDIEVVYTRPSGGNASVTQDQDGYIVLPVTGSAVTKFEYESGTWIPSSDTVTAEISFTNTHTEAPFFYAIYDADGNAESVTNTAYMTEYFNFHQLSGKSWDLDGSTEYYGLMSGKYRSSSTALQNNIVNISAPYTDSSESTTAKSRYWATETRIIGYLGSSRYWRANRTYKWIAIWK